MYIKEYHFSVEEKYTIILQIMLSIVFLHLNGYIYRDLKPSNIMIDSNKTAILIDFDWMINFNDSNHSFIFNKYNQV